VHTFHIHQVHFIVEAVNGRPASGPHWLDTVDVPPRAHLAHGRIVPSAVKVLIDFRDPVVRGTFLFHCHILDHEDRGMMAKIRVI
jgi:FtsP/CotA-like multicopper oxidase with cupredoxin domain